MMTLLFVFSLIPLTVGLWARHLCSGADVDYVRVGCGYRRGFRRRVHSSRCRLPWQYIVISEWAHSRARAAGFVPCLKELGRRATVWKRGRFNTRGSHEPPSPSTADEDRGILFDPSRLVEAYRDTVAKEQLTRRQL